MICRITKKDLKISSAMVLLSILIGILVAHSTSRWMDGIERGTTEISVAKKELLLSAGLFDLHNAVYAKVGEARWERQVKPDFLSAITRATAWDTGDPFPSWRMVVDWVRDNPEDARRMLKDAAANP